MDSATPSPAQRFEQEEVVYLAGQRVPPGIYRQVGTHREVCLEREDLLPASLDGQIACYLAVVHQWHQHEYRQESPGR